VATITVTLRIDLEAVLSVGDLLMKQGARPSEQPISTSIRTVLESLMELMRTKGQLPLHHPEDITKDFQEMFKQQTDLENDLEFSGLDDILKERLSGQDPISRIASQVEHELGPGSVPEIRLGTGIRETKDIPTINVFELFSREFEDLEKQAPKDRFIATCQDPKVDKLFKKAVCVAYSTLPIDLWGSPAAENMIRDLLKQHNS